MIIIIIIIIIIITINNSNNINNNNIYIQKGLVNIYKDIKETLFYFLF